MTRTLVVSLLVALLAGAAADTPAVPLSEIPSPRPDGWSVDLTGQIPADTLAQINRIGDDVKAKTGSEIAVVVVGTVGTVNTRGFATRLANHWGIGRKDVNDGLLIFVALDDHQAEIVLGSGIDDSARRGISEEIMQGTMVPRFKAGDPGGAVLAGAQACAERILGLSPEPVSVAPDPEPVQAAPLPLAQTQPQAAPEPYSTGPTWAVLAGLAALVVGAYGFIRFSPRRCPRCRDRMVRLSEEADDEYLAETEKTEERVGSVNYNVWLCERCGQVTKMRFAALVTNYAPCPACGARTVNYVRETVRPATSVRDGLVRITESCAHCSHQDVSTFTLPRLVQPAPYRPGWTAEGSTTSMMDFSSSTSSSSASSSDSGFSGGHSDGGGASGHW